MLWERDTSHPGPLEVGQDLMLIEIGNSVSLLLCPSSSNPSIAAITNANYQNTISAGGTVVVWGSNFSIGGNLMFWTRATGGQTVTLSENDGLYFWDQSGGQINATLGSQITPGLWYVSVENSCVLQSGVLQTFAVTVN